MVAHWRAKLALSGPILLLALVVASIKSTTPASTSKRVAQLHPTASVNNPDLDPVANLTPPSNCDLLFSTSDKIGSYCQCKDIDPDISVNDHEVPTDSSTRISQLHCYPQNFSQIIVDFNSYLALSKSPIRVDYFSIETNFTQDEMSPSYKLDRHSWRFLIDHISLQLTSASGESQNSGKTIDSNARGQFIEEQMIDFVRLINETHLQFLSIFLEDNGSGSGGSGSYGSNNKPEVLREENGNGTGHWINDARNEIKFGQLLSLLTGLSRLEVSLGQRGGGSLVLEWDTFRAQHKLKWLNLASNSEINFDRNIVQKSPFGQTPQIEYLSLESSNLKSFPLFSLFTVPLQELLSTTNASALHYVGLPNLTSLNLAGNKLNSLESDLFTQFSRNDPQTRSTILACLDMNSDDSTSGNQYKVFQLPALTQLDLSYNRIGDISFRIGQYILCSMPNLNQLYLQHNKIVHLNLNSLLTHPIEIPNSLRTLNLTKSSVTSTYPSKFSLLEHIDLSHNHLIKVSTIQWKGNTTSPTRVKSINLNFNELESPITLVDPALVNKVIFEESFKFKEKANNFNLDSLESFLILSSSEANAVVSICDFLSPASNRFSTDIDLLNEVQLSNNKISLIESKYFSSKQCRDIQILRLAQNRIESIDNDSFFELRSLEQLDLSDNLISHLGEDTFSRNSKLRILDLSNNRLESLKKNLFSHLTELESLSLRDNQISELPIGLFTHNSLVEIIDLSNNKLVQLDDLLLHNSNYLRVLNLEGNHLRKFPSRAFDNAEGSSIWKNKSIARGNSQTQPIVNRKQLTAMKKFNNSKLQKSPKRRNNRQIEGGHNILVLSFNQMESIHIEKCFPFVQNVQLLRLDHNSLSELSESSLSCFQSVQQLHLNSNQIRFIGEYAFRDLIQLEYLDLSKNSLSHVGQDNFILPNQLSHLDLSSNQLVSFKFMKTFSLKKDEELKEIESVNLNNNLNLKLDASDLIAFLNRVILHRVELGNIQSIKFSTGDINPTAPLDGRQYQTFNLSTISHIDESVLTALNWPSITIESIDLSYISTSKETTQRVLNFLANRLKNGLIELIICGNRYSNSDVTPLFSKLNGSAQIQLLNISDNQLEHWPFEARLAQKLNNLKSLDLSRNKLRYFIRDNVSDYSFPNMQTLNMSSNALISLADNPKHRMISLRNFMPQIKHLDLSHNRLSWIPLQFFEDLSDLIWLRLDNNQFESLSPVYSGQRLVMDLSFNHKLRTLKGAFETSPQWEMVEYDDLVLFEDNSIQVPQLRCQTIDDYIVEHEEHYSKSAKVRNDAFVDWMASKDEGRFNYDDCAHFIKMIDSMRMDSISRLIKLNSLQIETGRLLHVSLRRNGLEQIETSDRNREIVHLDLSENKIKNLPDGMCNNLVELKTLDLSNNQLDQLPHNLISSCTRLNYLDLSHNKISSAKEVAITKTGTSALLVLKLNDNMLRDLTKINLGLFSSLRFLDIRSNQLRSDLIIPKLNYPHLLVTSPRIGKSENYTFKSRLELNENSLAIFGSKPYGSNPQTSLISIMKMDNNSEDSSSFAYHPRGYRHLINFCTLSLDNDLVKVCLKVENIPPEPGKCFYLRTPGNVSPCLTNLHEGELLKGSNHNLSITNSSLLKQEQSSGMIDADPVLDFIEALKKYWIKVKELDVNKYLMSVVDIRSDSTFTLFNGRYEVLVMTLVKLLIVGGFLCIVSLLFAMLGLVTCQLSRKRHFSPKNDSLLANVSVMDTDTTESSLTNNSRSNTSTSQIHRTSLPSIPCPSARSKSSSETDDTAKATVMERKVTQQLDPNQLILQQQQCSTPSSSLAPSSVETAETLQAVDSIKSGTPVQFFGGALKRSVDQYGDCSNTTNNNHPQHQVATVMRMVKSNSANFDPSVRSVPESQYYGTLNNRNSNYPMLKSKLRAIHENQKRQVYPANFSQSKPMEVNDYDLNGPNIYNQATDPYLMTTGNFMHPEQDSTTMSLISINSALSSGQTIVPLSTQQLKQDNYLPSDSVGQAQNLCHYHRLLQEPHGGTGVIMEQLEEEQNLPLLNNLPPPPPSRVIEALENSIYYMTDAPQETHFSHN